jgi:hypothetical protein
MKPISTGTTEALVDIDGITVQVMVSKVFINHRPTGDARFGFGISEFKEVERAIMNDPKANIEVVIQNLN